ncbi:MAG: lytic transglycosylase domain-containing protein [Desulforudis sp.]|jgi:soluble lytic murein transglycosylase-like protein|nr:MAG: lytic transglycosylase domain-containing protein [Desulforudis sp.]
MDERLKNLWPLIQAAAAKYDLDPFLVGAMVLTESGGDPWAARYEPAWRGIVQTKGLKPSTCSDETEQRLQMTSFGLMQVMGAVAREHKFQGWLTRVCDPEAGLDLGCRHLRQKIDRFGSIDAGIAAYNQGNDRRGPDGRFANQPYVDKVKGRMQALKSEVQG